MNSGAKHFSLLRPRMLLAVLYSLSPGRTIRRLLGFRLGPLDQVPQALGARWRRAGGASAVSSPLL